MNRAMILPAAIAAGMHIALLGFKSSPATPAAPPEKPELPAWRPYVPPPTEEEIEVFREETEEVERLRPPADIAPRGAEVFPPDIPDPTRDKIVVKPSDYIPGDAKTLIPPGGGPGSVLPGGPIDIINLENTPRALVRTSPKAPHGFNELRATVTVEFVVGKDGKVMNARVVASTHASLEEPCLREVRRWRFEAGIKNGLPVAFRVAQEFVFTMHD